MPTAPNPSRPLLARSLTLQDLTDDLLWPKLLKAGQLALRPQRIALAFVFLIGLALIGGFSDWADGNPTENELSTTMRDASLSAASIAARSPDVPMGAHLGRQLHAVFIGQPRVLLFEAPAVALFVVPLIFFWTALCGGAISRSAACDFAEGVSLSWPQAVGFALSRCASLFASLFVPIALIWLIAFGLTVAGWALFSLAYLNVLGSLLWMLFLVAGVIAAVIAITYTLGAPMLVPSIACEGTDAIDAIQHAYSFVFARPLRLVMYLAILALQGVLLLVVVATVLWLGTHIAQQSALHWSGERGAEVLADLPGHVDTQYSAANARQLSGSQRVAEGTAKFWSLIPVVLLLSVPVSFAWSGSTVLYLLMRRLVDGQEISEIWMPTLIPGTMAPAMPTPGQSQGVSDTDLADET